MVSPRVHFRISPVPALGFYHPSPSLATGRKQAAQATVPLCQPAGRKASTFIAECSRKDKAVADACHPAEDQNEDKNAV